MSQLDQMLIKYSLYLMAEGDEVFLLQLKTPPSPSVLGVPSSAIITIVDDDGKIPCIILKCIFFQVLFQKQGLSRGQNSRLSQVHFVCLGDILFFVFVFVLSSHE